MNTPKTGSSHLTAPFAAVLLLASSTVPTVLGAGFDANFASTFPLTGTFQVYAVATQGSDVYVAANNGQIYHWNSSSGWDELPNAVVGVNTSWGGIFTIRIWGSGSNANLYVGGRFDTVGTNEVSAHNVARYNRGDGTWDTMAGGVDLSYTGFEGIVYAIDVASGVAGTSFVNYVYVGGEFNIAGTQSAANIARYYVDPSYGATWQTMNGGVSSHGQSIAGVRSIVAYALSDYSNVAYVGGGITRNNAVDIYGSGSGTANNLAKWAESSGTWYRFGAGVRRVFQDEECELVFSLYETHVSRLKQSWPYIFVGGFFNAVDDNVVWCPSEPHEYCYPELKAGAPIALAAINIDPWDANYDVIAIEDYINIVDSMAVVGTDVFLGGLGPIYQRDPCETDLTAELAMARIGGGWTDLSSGSGSPSGYVLDTAGSPSHVIFVGHSFVSRWVLD